ncbi:MULTISPECIES: cold shock domain-containing protein [unclassified Shewanella]|jgi:cold shock CspA family protein|uniref:cold shock domain-containing protein n=1 Tax=unclassified Shewanella TaxID=196818 RepID=UPI000C32660C|nr:cold shock domain-containing protein [Shewanella sp. ALD9]PKH29337.1 hypothetical protein CXF88_17535 [Shewanella sp. ALD9]
MKGKISQWNDEKGFGFISISDKKSRVFFHVSTIRTRGRRPEVGDSVDFELSKDKNGKIKASSVSIDGLSPTNSTENTKRIKVDPPKKDVLDYLLMIIILSSLSYTGYQFYLFNNLEKVWPYAIPAIVAFLFSGRNKKPKQDHYSCTNCKAVERFNPRTVEAWNRGITRLFCNKCHKDWLRNKPREETQSYSRGGSSSGCLGSFLIILTLPVISSVAIYQWLV